MNIEKSWVTNLQNLNHKAQNAEQRGQKARKKDITEAADYSLHLTAVSMKRAACIMANIIPNTQSGIFIHNCQRAQSIIC